MMQEVERLTPPSRSKGVMSHHFCSALYANVFVGELVVFVVFCGHVYLASIADQTGR